MKIELEINNLEEFLSAYSQALSIYSDELGKIYFDLEINIKLNDYLNLHHAIKKEERIKYMKSEIDILNNVYEQLINKYDSYRKEYIVNEQMGQGTNWSNY